jgi:hypothetical protein
MKFQLKTKIIYWDERTVYYNHVFFKDGKLIANCLIGVVLVGKDGRIAPQRIMSALGASSPPPYIDVIEHSDVIDRYLLNEPEYPDPSHDPVKKD